MKLLMNDYSQHMEGIGKGGGGVRRTGHYDPKNPRYEVEAPLSGPRVLGLTATIIKGNPKPNAQLQIQKQILEFEKLFKSQAVTFPDFSEVARYTLYENCLCLFVSLFILIFIDTRRLPLSSSPPTLPLPSTQRL